MGAEASSYQDLQLEDELPVTGNHGWTVHDARNKDGVRATVFLHNKSSTNTEPLQNAAKHLKTLRHPSVLKFLALTKSSHGLMLVTEHVTPLEIVLENLSATEIAGGIHNILEALVFLHDRVGITHNNVCMSSIYVSDDGEWRLGGMEHVCTFQEATPSYLAKCKPLRDEATIAPEEKSGKVETSAEYGYVRDAYAFGVLAESLMECLADLGDMIKTFELRIQDELLHPDPKMRPHLRTLPADRLFRNEFLEIVRFLQHITLKSEEEKKVFFSGLVKKLYDLPSSLVASRLARPLLSRFVLLDNTALESVIPHLLTPCTEKVRGEYREGEINPVLLTSQFRQYVVPEIYKIFHVRDAHIRLVLLSRFSQYVSLFDKNSLEKVILPQILLGLRDTNDELVRASLIAVGELVPILGGDVVIGTHRDKIFSEGIPKFGNRGSAQTNIKMANMNSSNNAKDVPGKEIPNNKVKESRTLKDIAKERDREKRREEIKQRNMERRRKREEKMQTSESKNKSFNEENMGINNEDKHIEDLELENQKNEINRGESSPTKGKWSDWDANETEVTTDNEGDDYDYDKEIEEELRHMDSMSPSKVFQPIEQGPAVSVDWSDARVSDNNSPSKTQKTRGMLKLKSKSKSSPPPKSKNSIDSDWPDNEWGFQDGDHGRITPRKSASPKAQSPRTRSHDLESESGDVDYKDDWGDDWEGGVTDGLPSPAGHSISKTKAQKQLQSKLHRQSSGQSKDEEESIPTTEKILQKDQDLGSEYDIKSISVKTKDTTSDPFDFFSDMEPVIKAKNPLTELAERTSAAVSKESTENKVTANTKLSFAVMETDNDADGWGDDGWGDDDILEEDNLES